VSRSRRSRRSREKFNGVRLKFNGLSGGAPDCSVSHSRRSRRSREKFNGVRLKFIGLSGGALDYSVIQRSTAQSARDAWARQRSAGGTGLSGVHRTVSGAPTATNLQRSDAPKKEGDRALDSYRDCPVCHPTEGKICLSRMPPTTPSCLGAIKGSPRRMEE
jgi:hypothetical protein